MNIIEILFLLFSVSLDTFFAGISYGIEKIKVNLLTILMTSGISTIILFLSMTAGSILQPFLSSHFCRYLNIGILLFLGGFKIYQYLKKQFLRKNQHYYKIGKIELVISISNDPKKADLDHSKNLSFKETLLLTIALSLDNFAIGLSLGLLPISIVEVSLIALSISIVAIVMGVVFGKILSKKFDFDLSWISGLLLIILAIAK